MSSNSILISSSASNSNFSIANSLTTNRTILEQFEKVTPNKVLAIRYRNPDTLNTNTITSATFQTIDSIDYWGTTRYIYDDRGDKKPAFKIFAYIQIINAGEYIFNPTPMLGGFLNIFLNGFLIISFAHDAAASDRFKTVYLQAGTYQLYIERVHDTTIIPDKAPVTAQSQYRAFAILFYPASSTNTNTFIDSYLHPTLNYTLLTNATTSRDKGIIEFCKPESNLFTPNNICRTSLTSSNLLQSTLNNHCLPNNGTTILTGSDNKMDTKCRAGYGLPNLNNNIRSDFNTRYNTWARNIASSSQNINNNRDALEEYIIWRQPNETDFPINSNITTFCENNIKDYNINSTNSSLCNTIYNRTYNPETKTRIDNSIRKIRHNFCTQSTNNNYTNITGTDCQNELKKTDLPARTELENHINDYCFPSGNIKKGTNSLYDPVCKNNIHNISGLNTNIKNRLDNSYNQWATTTITKADTNYANEESALNEYIKDRNPTLSMLFNNKSAPVRLTTYCEGKIGDNYEASPTADTMCDRLYTNSLYQQDPNIKQSIENKKLTFCQGNDSTNKPRYETNSNCQRDYTTILATTIRNRCIQSNTYQNTDTWCNQLSDNNITNTSEPYKSINEKRSQLAKEQLNSALNMTNAKLNMNTTSYNYIIGKYNDNPNKNLNDEVLTQKLFDFCEVKEPNYPTDPTSQCKGIYDKFNTNPQIVQSKLKMRDSLCRLPENITTNNTDQTKTNAFNCESTIFDTSRDLGKFANTVNTYCENVNNISTSRCQNYYTNIENKILNNYGIQSSSTNISSFDNNSKNDYYNKYENIELEGFENSTNNIASVNSSQEVTSVNSSQEVGSGNSSQEVTSVNSSQEVDSGNSSQEVDSGNSIPTCNINAEIDQVNILEESYSSLYIILLFIFFMLIIMILSSCLKKNSNEQKIIKEFKK